MSVIMGKVYDIPFTIVHQKKKIMDINVVQKANNDFNQSAVNAKQVINEWLDKLISTINSKRQKLLTKIDAIHYRNKKLFAEKLDKLNKMNKLCLDNKEQSESVACDKSFGSTKRLQKFKVFKITSILGYLFSARDTFS
eukprot:460292_1